MISRLGIQRSVSSLLLAIALLLPSAVQLAHTFEGHEHPGCTEFSTHIHEKQLDCSLCDFQVKVFDFSPAVYDYLLTAKDNFKTIFRDKEIISSFNTGITTLRGPPNLV